MCKESLKEWRMQRCGLASSTMSGAAISTAQFSPVDRIKGFVALTKPRIIELLLVETVPAMIVAKRGMPSLWLIFATVLGGTLAAGGANAINMYVDRDIDAVMKRTQNRPLVTGVVKPGETLVFAVILELLAFGFLWWQVNLLSAVLACSAMLFYVFIYTLWLKRRYTSNIVIGGAAGAVPVLVGWTAITNSLDWPPIILFAIIFYWTPPHFWALAIKYKDDYSSVEVPMLPSVAELSEVTKKIAIYTAILWALTILFGPVAGMGYLYNISAVVFGAVFMGFAIKVRRNPEPGPAMKLFHYSIVYLMLLFGAMAVDQLI